MRMTHTALVALIGLVAAASASASDAKVDVPRDPGRAATLKDGFASQEELIRRLLDALENKDADALRRLRVTETEYREILIPGHVPPGQPPRELTKQWRDYAWANLDTASNYYLEKLIDEFGGKALAMKDVRFEEGVQQYAGYKAYKGPVVTVKDDDGQEKALRTGSIVEIDGKLKFVGYNHD